MTVSKTTGANRTHGTIVLRGGRLTKWKGKAASLSPSLGQLIASVSPVALGRALMVGASKTATAAVLGGAGLIVTTSGASADNDCTGSDGVYTCSGEITKTNGGRFLNTSPLSVTISEEATKVNVTDGFAFNLKSDAGITFEDKTTGATITGDWDGIYAINSGKGALSITTTGTTTGTNGAGIYAVNSPGGVSEVSTDLTINAATTTGSYRGIGAINFGTGDLTITAGTTKTTAGDNFTDGDVPILNHGISAINSGKNLTITADKTYGFSNGIRARNLGTGALSITTTGTTTGKTKDGIFARNGEIDVPMRNNAIAGNDLTINAATTEGGARGIQAINFGKGALSITTTGTTTGKTKDGIFANNSYYGTDLTINAATTIGGTYGIRATNPGTGALSITTTGDTTGETKDGIFALSAGGGAVNITTLGAVTGGRHGINVENLTNDGNNGKTSITVGSTSTITTSAVGGYGILNRMAEHNYDNKSFVPLSKSDVSNVITVAGTINTTGDGAHGIVQDGGTSIANISGTVSAKGNSAAAVFHKFGSGHTVNLAESAKIIGSISAANNASNNKLNLNEDADFALTIGGAPDDGEPGLGTGAGQWSFQLVDEQGQALPSTRSNDGQKVEIVKAPLSECAEGSTLCYKAVYLEPEAEEQLEDITNIDNDALVDSLELGGSGGGSDKSGSSSTTAAQAHHNTVWANVYGIKTTGDETDSRAEMKSRTAGFTIGVPIRTNSDLNWDLVFNMSDSKNKLGSTGDQELNVQSYNLGAVFYNIAPSSGWDVDAFGFIGYNDYDNERDVRDNTEADGIDTRKFSYSGNEILLGFDAEYYKPFNETLDLKFGVNGFLSHQKIDSYSTGEYYKWDTRNLTQGSIGVSTGVEHRKGALMAYADIGVDYVTLLSGKTADYSFNGQSRSFTASDTDDVYGKVNVGFEYNQSENVIIDGKLSGFSSTGGISGYAATLGIEVNF